MADNVWHVRNVPLEVRKKVRLYAVEHGLSTAEALKEIVSRSVAMSRVLIRNGDGAVVGIQGRLPDGTIGIVMDEARPFTEDELEYATKFREHMDDLAKRMEAKK